MTTLHKIGEREAIRRLARWVPTRDDVKVGIGDDMAVIHQEGSAYDLLLTSDPVIEGTHFLRTAKAGRIGHKAIGRCLSDMAAMGGEPLWAVIDVVAPASMSVARIEDVYRGASKLAGKYGMAIVGGDMARGPALELHVFAVAQVPKNSAVLRSGAKAGDWIYVTGALGGSIAGKHLTFDPRLEEGLWLREVGFANAMIDVSDGLASDLRQILERSGTGAVLYADRIPVSPAAKKKRGKKSPLDHALGDGEDFELLFTVSRDRQAVFESSWKENFSLPCACIGEIVSRRRGMTLVGSDGRRIDWKGSGYEHFV